MSQKYTLIVEATGNEVSYKSESDGFNALEILGILERKRDIFNQMSGVIKPEFVERKIIKNVEQTDSDKNKTEDMQIKTKAWIEDGILKCCSQQCNNVKEFWLNKSTKEKCPRYDLCKEYDIELHKNSKND